MRRALIEHLRATGRAEEAEQFGMGQVAGLVAWGALAYAAMRAGQGINRGTSSWEHVPVPCTLSVGTANIEEVRKAVRL